MAYYRVLAKLHHVVSGKYTTVGTISSMKDFGPKSIEAFLGSGAITEVHPPPLRILPGWAARARALQRVGVVDAFQLLDADVEVLAGLLHTSRASLERIQQEVRSWLVLDEEE